MMLKFCGFQLLPFIIVSSVALCSEPSGEVLSKAESHLLRIKTIDCTFNFSRYDAPVRFQASGIMTRSDATFKNKPANGGAVNRVISMAFNGEIYQDKRFSSKTMRSSRERLRRHGTSGPCWSPIEYAYRWCQSIDHPLSWESLHDPLTWDRIRELSEPVTEECFVQVGNEQLKCVRVILNNTRASSSHVFFAINKGYFPVKREVHSQKGIITSEILVKSLIKIDTGDGQHPVWFPLIVSNSQIAMKQNSYTASKITYETDAKKLKVNHPIAKATFTLDYSGIVNVYLDDNEVYLPKTNKVIQLNNILIPHNPR